MLKSTNTAPILCIMVPHVMGTITWAQPGLNHTPVRCPTLSDPHLKRIDLKSWEGARGVQANAEK